MTNKAYMLRRLKELVKMMRSAAENISPIKDDGSGGDAHPAPQIRDWARVIETTIEDLSKKDD